MTELVCGRAAASNPKSSDTMHSVACDTVSSCTLCDVFVTAGIINSNAGNKDNDELCYKVKVPADCIDSDGHLLANKLVVRIAVSAFGGVLTTYNTNQVIHSAQEVEVQGNFATSMLDGRVVQLSPLLPLKAPWPGCKLHQRPSK